MKHFFLVVKIKAFLHQQDDLQNLSDLALNKLFQKMSVPDKSRVSLKYK